MKTKNALPFSQHLANDIQCPVDEGMKNSHSYSLNINFFCHNPFRATLGA
jgi:hypothetical protein